MNLIEELKHDLTNEYNITKKFLKHYPSDKNDWQPHQKSMNIQNLTNHIVDLFGWPAAVFGSDHLDFAKMPKEDKKPSNEQELESKLDGLYNKSMEALNHSNAEDLDKKWQMRHGETVINEMTKFQAFNLNTRHIGHHRAQLGVYYRLNDIPVPGTIGPSADEK